MEKVKMMSDVIGLVDDYILGIALINNGDCDFTQDELRDDTLLGMVEIFDRASVDRKSALIGINTTDWTLADKLFKGSTKT